MKKLFGNLFYAFAFWGIALVLGLVLLDKLIMPWAAGHFQKEVEVPLVQGKSVQEASAILKRAGLDVIVAKEKRNSPLAEGMVMQQIPAAGRTVREGRLIQIIQSAGNQAITLPDRFKGSSLAQAKELLDELGLLYTIKEVQDPVAPLGTVVRTQPEAQSVLDAGSTVTLFVSAKIAGATLPAPNLLGKTLQEVEQILAQSQMRLKKWEIDSARQSDQLGVVLSQNPAAGKPVPEGQSFTVVLSPE